MSDPYVKSLAPIRFLKKSTRSKLSSRFQFLESVCYDSFASATLTTLPVRRRRLPTNGELIVTDEDETRESPDSGDESHLTRTQAIRYPATQITSSEFPEVPGYRILDVLGRGGMGVVYRAKQLRANREVALKMIISGISAGADERARFRIEAEAIARLQHLHIVSVFEVGEFSGRPFFSMEYCAGGSLAAKVGERSFSIRDAATLALKIAQGMAIAHEAGIVHRDLKPQNILLAADGTPKITDFGIAKRIGAAGGTDGLTETGAILGTPSYMAPEQALGESKQVGPEADVYAIGAILYSLLLGRAPFVGPTPMDTMLRVIGEEPERPRISRPDIPVDLEAICLKCLEKDRRKRYSNAKELADDLARFFEGETVSASRGGLIGRVAGAMERVQLNERFADYSSILSALSLIMLLPEALVTLVVWNDSSGLWLPLIQFGRIAAFIGVIGYFRRWNWMPQGVMERHLWMVWGGYLFCCATIGIGRRVALNDFAAGLEVHLYQPIAALTALAFFSLSASFWGYSVLIGIAFLVLVFVMAIDIRMAPLEYGLLWAAVLIMLSRRLKAIGANPSTMHRS